MDDASTGTLSIDRILHHGSHRQLLRRISASNVPGTRVDAIVVPAARSVESLGNALALATDLSCGVIVLCSGNVTATEAAVAGNAAKASLIALDVGGEDYGLPQFETKKVPSRFARPSDTSLKRNLGLVVAKVAGLERLLFLDDDIVGITRSGARAAAALAEWFDAVGLENKGYPDNSVVCHTYRELEEGGQQQFIGVGALAVDARSNPSFFPNIYNQDWMFMLGSGPWPRLAVTGRMKQVAYDPFADPDRARREEFGDCIGEGLYWLLDEGVSIERADSEHWTDFLKRRLYFIQHLIARVEAGGYEKSWGERVLDSLQLAQETNAKVTPETCLDFVQRWRADLGTWREFIAQLPADLGVAKALEHLGWPGVVQSERPWPAVASLGEDRLIFPNGRACVADQQADRPSDRSGETSPFAPAAT